MGTPGSSWSSRAIAAKRVERDALTRRQAPPGTWRRSGAEDGSHVRPLMGQSHQRRRSDEWGKWKNRRQTKLSFYTTANFCGKRYAHAK